MRLQFKHQKFQQDATNAVCDILQDSLIVQLIID